MSNYEDLVENRHSVRNFTDKKIEGNVLEELKKEVNDCNKQSGLNIQLALNETKAFGEGHYGKFNNCKNYIAIIGNKNDENLNEKSGYYGEKPFNINDNEKLVIVIATGYGVNQGVAHKVKDFKAVSKTIEDVVPDWYKKGIEFALFAPTAINQQKFVFELKENNKVIAKAKLGPCSKIDLGIVKYHFEIGAGADNFEWIK